MSSEPETSTALDELVRRSVQSILFSQGVDGAIVASPDFTQYQFCWLRDASFCAYALDLAGEYEASERYHQWVRRAVERIKPLMESVTIQGDTGAGLNVELMPPARFSLDGMMVHDDWPNFQIDGYGTWLWSLEQHLRLSEASALGPEYQSVVLTVSRYISEFAFANCYDVWEENGGDRHTSTLACVYGGLSAAHRLCGDRSFAERGEEVRRLILTVGGEHGYFTKSSANHDVDASVTWLSVPFGVVEPRDELFAKTVSLIESRLRLGGGIRRYPTDVYYGSGAWPVLAASLGWHLVATGDRDGAHGYLDWVISKFDTVGRLAEQFDGRNRDRLHYDQWVDKWGIPAQDLTWSHAMFVILAKALAASEASAETASVTEARVDNGNEPGKQTT